MPINSDKTQVDSTFSELLNDYGNTFFQTGLHIMKTKPQSCTPVTQKEKHVYLYKYSMLIIVQYINLQLCG